MIVELVIGIIPSNQVQYLTFSQETPVDILVARPRYRRSNTRPASPLIRRTSCYEIRRSTILSQGVKLLSRRQTPMAVEKSDGSRPFRLNRLPAARIPALLNLLNSEKVQTSLFGMIRQMEDGVGSLGRLLRRG